MGEGVWVYVVTSLLLGRCMMRDFNLSRVPSLLLGKCMMQGDTTRPTPLISPHPAAGAKFLATLLLLKGFPL